MNTVYLFKCASGQVAIIICGGQKYGGSGSTVVPSKFEYGVELVHADDIPNTSSLPRIQLKIYQFLVISDAWMILK